MSFDYSRQIGFGGVMSPPLPESTLDLEALSPEALIVRIAQHKDRAAYALLFARFAPKLKAFVMGRALGGVGLSALEAEDLVQDALLKVWRKADSFDATKATAATWIFTIARNLRIDAARKAARKKPLPDDLWQDSPQTAADQSMISAQDAKKLTTLMTILPQEQKDVIKLSFYDEFSHAEIAKRLDVPLGTVKSRLRLALNRLKSALGSDGAAK